MLAGDGKLLAGLSLTATKWPMPCWSGVLPVAIVVQMTGLSSGGELRSRPYAPSCLSLAKFGSLPSDISRSTALRVHAVEAEHDHARAAERRSPLASDTTSRSTGTR